MIRILPAIDLYQGKVVRLRKGNFSDMTVYGEDPLEFAEILYSLGARHLHVVDLEGAKLGKPVHLDVLYRLTRSFPFKVEFGGGLRTVFYIEDALEAGADRVIVSTRALKDIEFLEALSENFTDRIAISIDVKRGEVYASGWQEKALSLDEALELISKYQFPHVIFTDIERDGTNQGVNIEFVESVLMKSPAPVTIAGGVSSIEDIEALSRLQTKGLEGIIVGRAFYEGLIDLREVFEKFPQEVEV